MRNNKTLRIAFIAMFAAIISFSGFIKIPLGPIPIVLQNVFCILCAVLLGGIFAGAPVLLFLAAGLIGLPVYSGGTSGIAVWAGLTGGFLYGYLFGAVAAGLIAGKPSVYEKKLSAALVLRITAAVLAGMIILYIPGVLHFAKWAELFAMVPEGKSVLAYTLGTCVIPFIPGDLIKCAIAIPVALKVRPVLAQYLYADVKPAASNDKDQ